MHHHDLIEPLFLVKKFDLSLSHLVPEMREPKVDLNFHQNVVFNTFLSILYQFAHRFSTQVTTFFIDLKSFTKP